MMKLLIFFCSSVFVLSSYANMTDSDLRPGDYQCTVSTGTFILNPDRREYVFYRNGQEVPTTLSTQNRKTGEFKFTAGRTTHIINIDRESGVVTFQESSKAQEKVTCKKG